VIKLIGVVVLGLLVVAVLVISLVPLMGVTYYEIEAYSKSVEGNRTETYYEEVPVAYEITADPEINNLWWRPSSECSVTIKNTDDESGYFRIEFNIVTLDGEEVAKDAWQELAIGEQKEVVVRHNGDHVRTFTYSVTPPTKLIPKQRQVPCTMEVIEYGNVTKTDKVTVLEYLTEWRGHTPTPALAAPPTSTLAPTCAPPPTPTPTPIPTTVSKTFNITRTLSGLSITLTVVEWTGNEASVQWEIENHEERVFEASRLHAIFYPGARATDQASNEGEYFVPSPIEQDLRPGATKHYEARWVFFPESAVITIQLDDFYMQGSSIVEASAEFAFLWGK